MGYIEEIFERVKRRDHDQPEFHQAVWEVLESLAPVLELHPEYREYRVLERLVEPERMVLFRVSLTVISSRTLLPAR